MKPPGKIVVVDRFAALRAELLTLLAGLCEEDWARQTPAARWSVKDVAAHLLGGDVGILSRERDHLLMVGATAVYSELVSLVDRMNEEWVVASRRMSPAGRGVFLLARTEYVRKGPAPQLPRCLSAGRNRRPIRDLRRRWECGIWSGTGADGN